FFAPSSTLFAALLIPSFTSSAVLLTPVLNFSQDVLASSRTLIAASSAFLSPFSTAAFTSASALSYFILASSICACKAGSTVVSSLVTVVVSVVKVSTVVSVVVVVSFLQAVTDNKPTEIATNKMFFFIILKFFI